MNSVLGEHDKHTGTQRLKRGRACQSGGLPAAAFEPDNAR